MRLIHAAPHLQADQPVLPHPKHATHSPQECVIATAGDAPPPDRYTSTVLHTFAEPASPHLAAALENRVISDQQITADTLTEIRRFADRLAAGGSSSSSSSGRGLCIVETAGGVASPAPSGNIMVGMETHC